MKYQTIIGLEVHLQLKTKTKAFCGCPTEFGNSPNSQVCPVCLGLPGSLPVLNKTALDYAIRVGVALDCSIQEFTKFDRKHYYYPDLPKNFQISQYDLPICKEGFLDIKIKDTVKRINIRRIHLEEDAGKLIHEDESSLVDYNRAGVALLEIVSDPDINSPIEAYNYLTKLKNIIAYLDVSDCDMEKGSLRCDANISLKKTKEKELGIKTELKNLNSFKAVKEALEFEVKRQSALLENNELVIQETRLWNEKEQKTYSMRAKEEARDYRYFPEPDLPPLSITREKINAAKAELPELPEQKAARFIQEYKLTAYDAAIITSSRKDAEFSEDCLKLYNNIDKKNMANWLIGPLLSEANIRRCSIFELKLTPKNLVKLLELIDKEIISNLNAKLVLPVMIDTGIDADKIMAEKNLSQVSDTQSLELYADEVIRENPKSAADYKNGKINALMFMVGQVMKKSKGKANPKVVQEILKRRIS
ncbi:MAG: Asp-tRNA(Asn)/Glu-tRNA(Gln) amidotransferase subunit GatB [Candidatus Omnitrophota bacterium]|nr:Asp-tRNA(Asn)/Glu-tRNA(Gln) amidotransferase subunit GatB [Candidatus Omnitrophota bacterium]